MPRAKDSFILQILSDVLAANPFLIENAKVASILKLTGLDQYQLLQQLIPIAKSFARPLISNYLVAAAGLGKSGNIYLGVNLEFTGVPLNQSVHGEQFVIANARNHGETELLAIATSEAPCGHCRQFFNELGGDATLQILAPDCKPRSLIELLPASFGPKNFGLTGGLLTPCREPFQSRHPNPLIARAIEASHFSYSPYSKSPSGVAIRLSDGPIHTGGCLENAAFNPSLSPFLTALVSVVASKHRYDEMSEVVLVEQKAAKISHAFLTEEHLKRIAPHAKFHLEILDA
ncbi:MAG: cytidine deaminase [Verrucomicrobia bacterium]|nr:cytidine deaminase [Verrucomicrobiota bacterium]